MKKKLCTYAGILLLGVLSSFNNAHNSGGQLFKIPVTGGEPELIPTGFAKRINNDHGISFDGTQLAISDGTETGRSLIYTLPVEGGDPKKVTPAGPSYWHGWSPDGPEYSPDVPAGSHPPNKDVMLRIMNLETKEVRIMAELFGGQGTITVPSWSPDSEHVAFVRYRLN